MEKNKNTILDKIILAAVIAISIVLLSSISFAETINNYRHSIIFYEDDVNDEVTEVQLDDDVKYYSSKKGWAAYDQIATYMVNPDELDQDLFNEETKDIARSIGIQADYGPFDGGYMISYYSGVGHKKLLPANQSYLGRGEMPQYFIGEMSLNTVAENSNYNMRYVALDKSRWNLSTKSWLAQMTGRVAYCAQYGRAIRFGDMDPNIYYFPNVSFINTGSSNGHVTEATIEQIQGYLCQYIMNAYYNLDDQNDLEYFPDTSKHYYSPEEAVDSKKPEIIDESYHGLSVTYFNGKNYAKAITGWTVSVEGLNGAPMWADAVEDSWLNDTFKDSIYSLVYSADMGSTTDNAISKWEYEKETAVSTQVDQQINSRVGEEYATVPNNPKLGVVSQPITQLIGNIGDIKHLGEVMIIESEPGESDGYTMKTRDEIKNNMYAYIFSSAENSYGLPEYARKYSLWDIQSAYWQLLYDDMNSTNPSDYYKTLYDASAAPNPSSDLLTEKGKELAETAEKYERFKDKLDTEGYTASIDTSMVQNISNFSEKQYVLGPYKLYYDDIKDVNYVKELIIEYGNSEKLIYGINGEQNEAKDFDIVLQGDTGTKSNGMEYEYPKNGQNFFIIIDANKIGFDTKSITLHARFEHVDLTYADYETYEAKARAYRYNAFTNINSGEVCQDCGEVHDMQHATIRVKVTYETCKKNSNGGYDLTYNPETYYWTTEEREHTTTIWVNGEPTEHTWTTTETVIDRSKGDNGIKEYEYWTTNNQTHTLVDTTINIYIPYVKMGDKVWHEEEAQKISVIGDTTENAYRSYEVVEIEAPRKTDLTIELGGYVWVDENGGKEDVANGVYDQGEEKVSNLIVRLFKYGDEVFADRGGASYLETKTDANGNYKFENISPMYKYYVKFAYNGQYYEPTNYTSPYDSVNGWAKGNWQLNSNAVDKKYEREEYNDRFATINSSSENYTSMQYSGEKLPTYTKMELLGYTLQGDGQYSPTPTFDEKGNVLPASSSAAIDKFGNVLNGNSSMLKYVVDSLTTAYTLNPTYANSDDKNATFNYDYYPTPDIFVVDDHLNNRTVSRTIYNRIDRISKGVEAAMAEPKIESILYPTAYYINLGLKPRQEVDMALKKDVQKVTLEINNHVHEYTYDTLDTFKCENGHTGKFTEARYEMNMETYRWDFYCPECGAKIEANWDITVRLQDGYYNENYSRGIYKSDYIYKVSAYGYGEGITTPEEARSVAEAMFGRTQEDELEIYVTYKIMVSNQSLSVRTRIDEIVDYYDKTYELVPERSYVEIYKNGEADKHSIVLSDGSVCGPSGSISDYKKVFIRGIGKNDEDSYYLGGGESAYFYVTFRVMKNELNGEKWIQLGEKGNLAEINGYSTVYEKGTKIPNIYPDGTPEGTKAGIVDMNSTPGNQTSKDEIRENDTDKAPVVNIHLYDDDSENRVIEGIVWEDERTKDLQATTIADGLLADGETAINGVTVQLVELMENGTEFIWREFGSDITGMNGAGTAMKGTEGDGTGSGMKETEKPIINAVDGDGNWLVQDYVFDKDNHNGRYAFKSFMPGNYVVRFKYGDTVRTALPQDLTIDGVTTDTLKGLNAKSYNGQDYKSTTYQTGIEQNKTYTWEQEPVKIVKENGVYRLWLGKLDTISNWEYGYVTYDGTKLVFSPEWDAVGQRQVAPKLTEVSTFKADASNNETVVLPTIEMVTAESLNTPVIDVNKQNGYLYDITKSDAAANVSDAKDIESRRNMVNDYSDNDVTNHIAEVLASHKSDYNPTNDDRNLLVEELMEKTQMTSETGLMVIEFEYDDIDTDIKDDPEYERQGNYTIHNVNLGLEERPKAQLEIEKEITNVKLTLADSSILFDAKQSASNVLWSDHKDYKTGYTSDNFLGQHHFMDPAKYGNIANIRTINMAKFGLVQLTMDEELMHGATIKIDYKVTIRNVGEVDYYETYTLDTLNEDGTTKQEEKNRQNRLFYYTGAVTDTAKVVTTKADEVMDYVANNLQFNVADNNVENSNKWQVKSNDEIKEQGLVNTKLIEDKTITLYNTKIFTESLNSELVPVIYKDKVDNDRQDTTSIPLVLTQLITAENDTDDLTYRNMVEIVRTSNKVGRRMEYSVVGNQDPVMSPAEIDTDLSETVRILPPFGSAVEYTMYIINSIIAITAAGILITTIIFVKQKVSKKH